MNEQDFMKRFSTAIACWRKRLGMTAQEFADFVGISKNTIHNYENGHRMPQLYTAMLIAERLGTTLDDLLRGE